ncbi:MAG: PQQ-dependent sugar dehydrogenase [Bdellovibrionaceae bacterium]|nr:PQQ-dependent sugar dehydrogenase [Pseudobdellovibrionaceae bacterium]
MGPQSTLSSLLRWGTGLGAIIGFGLQASALPAGVPPEPVGSYRLQTGSSCGGFPRLPVQTMKGACLGLVMDVTTKAENSTERLTFPRRIVALPGGDFLVTDMGGWSPKNKGKVFRLVKETKGGQTKYKLRVVFQGLLLPHGLALGPDGFAYVGEMGTLFKFDPKLAKPQRIDVIKGLPTNLTTANVHPLLNFTFGQSAQDKWDLYINVGAPTDRCTTEALSNKACDQADGSPGFAQVRRYAYLGRGAWNQKFEVFARGLRNSMALVSHPSGTLLQAENSRDLKDITQPFEEVNVLKKGKHYGWPYCFNFNGKSTEWPAWDCQSNRYEKPYLLMPPHVAPLDMFYYKGAMFPELRQTLLISWHGYQPTGQRVVSYAVDSSGLPILDGRDIIFKMNTDMGTEDVKGQPLGGLLRSAPYREVISEWFPLAGLRPKGAPVGMAEGEDGALWVVDDKNKTILRMARSSEELVINSDQTDRTKRAEGWVKFIMSSPKQKAAFEEVRNKVFQVSCQQCHSGFVLKESDRGNLKAELEFLFMQPTWLSPGSPETSLLVKRMKGEGGTLIMPPTGAVTPDKLKLVETWLKNLK